MTQLFIVAHFGGFRIKQWKGDTAIVSNSRRHKSEQLLMKIVTAAGQHAAGSGKTQVKLYRKTTACVVYPVIRTHD